ncbi:hypothetical protein GCM10009826_11940 [Humibacillus xanthopallidus]
MGRSEPGRPEPGRSEPGRSEPGRSEPGRREPGRPEPGRSTSSEAPPGVGRRALLRNGLLAAGGLGVATVAAASPTSPPRESTAATAGLATNTDDAARTDGAGTVAFRGNRQAGVVDPPQPYASFVGLDLPRGATRETCARLLRVWTDDIERLMSARAPLTDLEPELAEVPSGLTVTVAVGPGFYDAAGLTAERPDWLTPLPAFSVDRLGGEWPQTDLLLQVCAVSPVAVAHAQRRLVVGADTLAEQRWVQRGFREPLTQSRPELTFRTRSGRSTARCSPGSTASTTRSSGSAPTVRPLPRVCATAPRSSSAASPWISTGGTRPTARPARTPSAAASTPAPR